MVSIILLYYFIVLILYIPPPHFPHSLVSAISVIATFVADLWNSKWHTVLALAVGFQVFRFFVLFHSDW